MLDIKMCKTRPVLQLNSNRQESRTLVLARKEKHVQGAPQSGVGVRVAHVRLSEGSCHWYFFVQCLP